jgi:hypothetical protein
MSHQDASSWPGRGTNLSDEDGSGRPGTARLILLDMLALT